ncbi:hypothetical protein N482_16575 [Pseudoalteromonas luteoviolacea NCIMB 1942]|uniref:Acyltransferase 3 domain-containing protein n=2 Tax=Pseudoalteromonas luteoviolacea TaxID=43657 RepID=A0A166ZJN9_9GAMM|nr:hypothetical protein N482_16575 [Pseudoalteromonas luteoviolacea NCIMB 1942]
MNSILDNIGRYGTFNPWFFIASRVDRVYPPLLFAFALSIAIYFAGYYFQSLYIDSDGYNYPVIRESIELNLNNYFLNFFLLNEVIVGVETINNNGPLWSVALEFSIYMLACAVVMFVCNKNLIAGLLVLLFLLYQVFAHNTQYFVHLICWVVGAFSCLRMRGLIRLDRRYFVFFALLSMCYLVLHYGVLVPAEREIIALFELAKVIFCFFIVCIFIDAIRFPKWLWLFKNYAYFSYTLYLIHFPIFLFVFSLVDEVYLALSLLEKLAFLAVLFITTVGLSAFLAKKLETVKYFRKIVFNKYKPVKVI